MCDRIICWDYCRSSFSLQLYGISHIRSYTKRLIQQTDSTFSERMMQFPFLTAQSPLEYLHDSLWPALVSSPSLPVSDPPGGIAEMESVNILESNEMSIERIQNHPLPWLFWFHLGPYDRLVSSPKYQWIKSIRHLSVYVTTVALLIASTAFFDIILVSGSIFMIRFTRARHDPIHLSIPTGITTSPSSVSASFGCMSLDWLSLDSDSTFHLTSSIWTAKGT